MYQGLFINGIPSKGNKIALRTVFLIAIVPIKEYNICSKFYGGFTCEYQKLL